MRRVTNKGKAGLNAQADLTEAPVVAGLVAAEAEAAADRGQVAVVAADLADLAEVPAAGQWVPSPSKSSRCGAEVSLATRRSPACCLPSGALV